jgi:DNA gyrase subunit A
VAEEIIRKSISDELVDSYINYSMSVIIGRAIPDVRDGLKPVQRRILYGMYQLGLNYNGSTKKSARIVGEVMGKYHPHGDMAIYDTLVRMSQDFTMRYPIVHGQGNFGSIDRDPAAAMRYTEAKLSKIAEEMLADIEENTVDMIPNFDESLKEPAVLPAKVPQLLMNGASGIAVGMSTSIPPHNLGELVDMMVKLIDNPDLSTEEVAKMLKGPDFPTGGIIMDSAAVRKIYETGRGSIIVRSKTHFEEARNRTRIIVTEIPYGVSKAHLIESIADFAKNSKENFITNIRDESDRKGLRIMIELSKSANPNVVLNRLYKHTPLQIHFAANMLVIDHGKPRLMNLKQLAMAFINHRFEVIKRRSEYELDKYSRRAHIVEGLIKASKAISAVISVVRGAKDPAEASEKLQEVLGVSEEQAKAILDMKLQRLTSLEHHKLDDEYKTLVEKMRKLQTTLGDSKNIMEEVKSELLEMKQKYADERKSEIKDDLEVINVEDLLTDDELVVTVTHNGYISSIKLDTYKSQNRGGKGNFSLRTRDEDYVEHVFITSRLSYTMFITNFGRAYFIKNYMVPESNKGSKGKLILNYLNLSQGEKVKSILSPGRTIDANKDLLIVTKRGRIKRTSLGEISMRSNGIYVIKLEEGDEIVDAELANADDKESVVALATLNGKIISFNVEEVRRMGRTAMGVTGIKLRENDMVVSMIVSNASDAEVLTITENGYGKRTKFEDYRVQHRGGYGVKNLKMSDKTGLIVGVKPVNDEDEIIAVTANGKAIRFKASDVSITSRVTMGVKCVRLDEGDKVVAFAVAKD